MKASNIVLFLALMSCIGCDKTLAPIEYTRYVKSAESGLLKEKTLGDIRLQAFYKPIPFVISSEIRKKDISIKEFKDREEELKKTQYIDMSLSVVNGGGDITNYNVTNDFQQQQRLHYLSFLIQENIKLVDGTDTLPPRLCHFERTYNLGKTSTFVLAFDRSTNTDKNDKTLIFDSPIFSTGPMKVRFDAEDLRKIPSLKLKS
ncbi:MAG: hypothetical protein GC192_20945 [Bacteroidetes bacterium]|nr:hypothetical protein [Bacteroidota bacterium]